MNILGLSFDFHDAAAALICGGRIIAAAQEERFSRKKNDPSLPQNAIRFCLKAGGLRAADLDAVVFYENPLRKFDRILRFASEDGRDGTRYLEDSLVLWLRQGKFDVTGRIAEILQLPASRIHTIEHHQSHAASAFFVSPFDSATIVTIDGAGEYETASVSIGQGTQIRKLGSLNLPDSLGLFYSAFTAFLGFEVNEGEYKVMGMSGFGRPSKLELIRRLITLDGDDWFHVSREHFNFRSPEEVAYTQAFLDLLGPPRIPDSDFFASSHEETGEEHERSRHYADIAASLQRVVEETILHVVSSAVKRAGIPSVCLAGGVALNSLANGRVERELGFPLFVQPAAGDAGGALGAALYYHHCIAGLPRTEAMDNVYLGESFSLQSCRESLRRVENLEIREFNDESALVDSVAAAIADGAVVGWFHGRFEWGPRALGARSILADPRRPEMQAKVNEKIKFRETFRPFAPSVLANRASEYFDLPPNRRPSCPEDFMLSVSTVHPRRRVEIPAVTHVDGTARLHLVRPEINPRFAALIQAFAQKTGVPLLLNTSFNRRGEPIVATPDQALEVFMWTGLDCLVLENLVVRKKALS